MALSVAPVQWHSPYSLPSRNAPSFPLSDNPRSTVWTNDHWDNTLLCSSVEQGNYWLQQLPPLVYFWLLQGSLQLVHNLERLMSHHMRNGTFMSCCLRSLDHIRSHQNLRLFVWSFRHFHYIMCPNNEGSGDTEQMCRLPWTITVCICDN